MKKLLVILGTMLLLAVLLAACGGKPVPTAAPTAAPVEATATSAPVVVVPNLQEWESQKEKIASHDLLVDGILGTGLKGEVQGFFQAIIEFMNSLGTPIVAIDIPSGLDADHGQVLGVCVRASLTVTFGLLRRGLLVLPGIQYCGKTVLVDISLPRLSVEAESLQDHLIEGSEYLRFLIPRRPDAHKGEFGHLFDDFSLRRGEPGA